MTKYLFKISDGDEPYFIVAAGYVEAVKLWRQHMIFMDDLDATATFEPPQQIEALASTHTNAELEAGGLTGNPLLIQE